MFTSIHQEEMADAAEERENQRAGTWAERQHRSTDSETPEEMRPPDTEIQGPEAESEHPEQPEVSREQMAELENSLISVEHSSIMVEAEVEEALE